MILAHLAAGKNTKNVAYIKLFRNNQATNDHKNQILTVFDALSY